MIDDKSILPEKVEYSGENFNNLISKYNKEKDRAFLATKLIDNLTNNGIEFLGSPEDLAEGELSITVQQKVHGLRDVGNNFIIKIQKRR